MGRRRHRGWKSGRLAFALLALGLGAAHAAAGPKRACARVTIEGEVRAGQEWKTTLGQGWVFRVQSIAGSSASYSGWDLVVDREPPAGYPDALLLATLPYNSINEREIGTTFGLRAQDAIGWNPRSFHFLTNPAEFRQAQQLFLRLAQSEFIQRPKGDASDKRNTETAQLLDFETRASSGEFRILDARIVPGTADPMPFAQAWAMASSRTPHEVEPAPPGPPSARGKLVWMRFALTLWLPATWKIPRGLSSIYMPCPE